MKQLLTKKLADPDAEAVRRSHADAIDELQTQSQLTMKVLSNIVLPNAVGRYISHGLGRRPAFVGISAVRGAGSAGVVQDFASADAAGNPVDRTQAVWLRAIGFGGDISVDILVVG